MIVGGIPKLEETADGIRLTCKLSSDRLPERLHVSVGRDHTAFADTKRMDWALVAMLYPAMVLGEDLVIEGEVSPRLLHTVQTDLQFLLSSFHPWLSRIRVKATPCKSLEKKSDGVGLGFSGGIDSFASLIDYSNPSVPQSLRPTHLTMFEVGAIPAGDGRPLLFGRQKKRCSDLARSKELGAVFVESNLDELFRALPAGTPTGISHTHTLRNAAAAHLLAGGVGLYYHSSSNPYKDIAVVDRPKIIGYIEPILLPLLSSERLTFILAGAGKTRVEKTVVVAEDVSARHYLDVCVAPAARRLKLDVPNCGRCQKCARTLLVLEALGRLEQFERVFDLEAYRQSRPKTLRKLMTRTRGKHPGSSDTDAINFAKAKGVRLPFYPAPLINLRIHVAAMKKKLRRIRLPRSAALTADKE